MKKSMRILVPALAIFFLFMGYEPAIGASTRKSFKSYADHQFNAKVYRKGMSKIGHNILAWSDPSANFSKYRSITIVESGKRLLPVQNRFSYTPFITTFNLQFKQALNAKKGSGGSLRVETAVVECNPGNRAARFLIGLGAGKAACGAVCEVYEPGKSSPIMQIYTRDTGSMATFGGDSSGLMNHILTQLAIRAASAVNDKIGQ